MTRKTYQPRNAKERQLLQEWDKIVARQLKPLERGAKSRGLALVTLESDQPTAQDSPPRPSQSVPSRSTPGSSIALKPSPKYTGDRLLGIAVLHKSCLQPIFSQEEAVSVAQMRRN